MEKFLTWQTLANVANVVTILTLIWAIIYALFRSRKNPLGFALMKFVASLVRVTVIVIIIGLGLLIWTQIVDSFIMPWEEGWRTWVLNIIVYLLVTLALGIPAYLIGRIVWTSSFAGVAEFFNLFVPTGKKIKIKSARKLEIVAAKYGAKDTYFDVTDKLRSMVDSDRLQVVASNSLAGDPIPGTHKHLLIEFKTDGYNVENEYIEEGKEVTIKAN